MWAYEGAGWNSGMKTNEEPNGGLQKKEMEKKSMNHGKV